MICLKGVWLAVSSGDVAFKDTNKPIVRQNW